MLSVIVYAYHPLGHVMDTCLMRSNNDIAVRHRPRRRRRRAHAQNMCIFSSSGPARALRPTFRSPASPPPASAHRATFFGPTHIPFRLRSLQPCPHAPHLLSLVFQGPRAQSSPHNVQHFSGLFPRTSPFGLSPYSGNRSPRPASNVTSGTRVQDPKGDRPCG